MRANTLSTYSMCHGNDQLAYRKESTMSTVDLQFVHQVVVAKDSMRCYNCCRVIDAVVLQVCTICQNFEVS